MAVNPLYAVNVRTKALNPLNSVLYNDATITPQPFHFDSTLHRVARTLPITLYLPAPQKASGAATIYFLEDDGQVEITLRGEGDGSTFPIDGAVSTPVVLPATGEVRLTLLFVGVQRGWRVITVTAPPLPPAPPALSPTPWAWSRGSGTVVNVTQQYAERTIQQYSDSTPEFDAAGGRITYVGLEGDLLVEASANYTVRNHTNAVQQTKLDCRLNGVTIPWSEVFIVQPKTDDGGIAAISVRTLATMSVGDHLSIWSQNALDGPQGVDVQYGTFQVVGRPPYSNP